MKLLNVIAVFAIMFIIGCSPGVVEEAQEATPEAAEDQESTEEIVPTEANIEADLDTSSLDEIEEDLDLLILE